MLERHTQTSSMAKQKWQIHRYLSTKKFNRRWSEKEAHTQLQQSLADTFSRLLHSRMPVPFVMHRGMCIGSQFDAFDLPAVMPKTPSVRCGRLDGRTRLTRWQSRSDKSIIVLISAYHTEVWWDEGFFDIWMLHTIALSYNNADDVLVPPSQSSGKWILRTMTCATRKSKGEPLSFTMFLLFPRPEGLGTMAWPWSRESLCNCQMLKSGSN